MPYLKVDSNPVLNFKSKLVDEPCSTQNISYFNIKCDNLVDQLCYANQEFVKQLIDFSNKETINSIDFNLIDGKTDLIANQYEGGFKLWEGLYDIIDYLCESKVLYNFSKHQNLNVLELGCGSGLASIYVSKKLPNANIYLQDFNEEVIKYFTATNVQLNYSIDSKDNSRFNYMFGDWSAIAEDIKTSGHKFDLILSSETLYNCDNYEKFVKVIKTGLSHNGSVYIGSKSHYFGVGGGTYSFIDYLQNDGQLECDICHEIEAPLIRHILKINFKK